MDVSKLPPLVKLLYLLAFSSSISASDISTTDTSGQDYKCDKYAGITFGDDSKPLQKNDNPVLSIDIKWENDSFLPSGRDDRHYTNGMKLSWIYNPCRTHPSWLQEGFSKTLSKLFSRDFTVFSGGAIGMNMYTPANISNPNRNRYDRPYAGWLYGGLLAHAYDFQGKDYSKEGFAKSLHSLELQIGALGPLAMQEEVQKFVHDHVVSARSPRGWEHQIPRRLGIEAVYLYRKNHITPQESTNQKLGKNWLRIIPHAGFAVGNLVNYVNLGATLIIGNSLGDFPYLGIQPTFQLLNEDAMNSMNLVHTDNPRLYGYFGIDFRHYASNIFIEGAGAAKHDISLENNVHDFFFGVVYKPRSSTLKNCKFSYQIINRSQEFESRDKSLEKSHRFGQLGVEISI